MNVQVFFCFSRARVQECSGKGGTTALFWAARHGDVPSVRELLSAGASPLHGSVFSVEASRSFPRYPGGECALSAALQAHLEESLTPPIQCVLLSFVPAKYCIILLYSLFLHSKHVAAKGTGRKSFWRTS